MSNTITYVKCFEPISRKPYYYNCITHEAQWSVPKGAEAKNEDIDLPKEDLTVCNYFALVIKSYSKKNDKEVSLAENDIVHVLRSYQNGWGAGITCLDESGFFPLCCTKPIVPAVDFSLQSPVVRQSGESVRSFLREANESRVSFRHSTSVSSEIARVNSMSLHNQRRIQSVLYSKHNGRDEMLYSFYRILVESILSQDHVNKEDIEQIEAIRQRYRIALTDHLFVLTNIEDGLNLYTKYLADFEIMNAREIKMIYFNESTNNLTQSVMKTSQTSPSLPFEEYNQVNKEQIHRPFLSILSRDSIYKITEENHSSPEYYFNHFTDMYFKRDSSMKHMDSELYNFSTKVPTTSLLVVPEELVPLTIEAKKIIMMYMMDLPISGNPSNWFDRLTEIMKEAYLQDEVYCFLIKQTIANMQQSSEMRGWELINFVLTVRKPSRNLYSYVLHYIIRSLLHSEPQLTGLKLNALMLITGQVDTFKLSQAELERVNHELLYHSCFDCSLEEVLRLEKTIDLLQHYNLLSPTQNLFGSSSEKLPVDYYDVDVSSETVIRTLMNGALFAQKTLNSRSQKTRYLSIPPTLDSICFSRQGDDVDQTYPLSEVVSIDINETEKGDALIVLILTQKRNIVLQVNSVIERNRWYFYLKVLFSWYKVTGYTMIASMRSQLGEDLQEEHQQCLEERMVSTLSTPLKKLIMLTHKSFDAFIKEKTQKQTPYPHGIDLLYKAPDHTIPTLLIELVKNLARLRIFLILDPLKKLPVVNQTLKETVYLGDYSILDTIEDPLMLLALLKDWLMSLDGGLLPQEFFEEAMMLAREDQDEEVYQLVLRLPVCYRDTILYLARFAWSCALFKKSVTFDASNVMFARSYTFVIKGKQLHNESYTGALITRFIACILRAVSVHSRESFLPEDPLQEAISNYKVLLYSHIPPDLDSVGGYEYTIANLAKLEKTAETMFNFGILPEKNTFGCSRYSLPIIPSEPLALFYSASNYLLKTAETSVYSLGRLWISPSLSNLLYSINNKTFYIPWTSIQRVSGSPPSVLEEQEKKLIQGRCLSVVCGIATTIDLLFYSPEQRNCIFNLLDLLIEWNRDEAARIRESFSIKKEDETLLTNCRDYSDVKKFYPNLLPFVDALHVSFHRYITNCYNQLDLVTFAREQTEAPPKKEEGEHTNPNVLKVLVQIAQGLVAMKAHMEEGVFRQPGNKQLGTEYKKQVRMGNYDVIKTITGYKEMTSLLTSTISFEKECLIPVSFLPAINEVNQARSPTKAYELLCKLPDLNRYSLLYLCHLWYEVSQYSEVNKMTVDNICTCVCPSLIFINDNTEFLRLVSPLFPYLKQLILATGDVDLEQQDIRLSFE